MEKPNLSHDDEQPTTRTFCRSVAGRHEGELITPFTSALPRRDWVGEKPRQRQRTPSSDTFA